MRYSIKKKTRCLGLSTFFIFKFHILRYGNLLFPKDVSICFLYLLNYVGNIFGLRESRFCEHFGRSKNVLKNIAIDQESLISHFWIIKTHKNHKNQKHIEKTRKNNKIPDLFTPIESPYRAPMEPLKNPCRICQTSFQVFCRML